jgi:hypothetical protein
MSDLTFDVIKARFEYYVYEYERGKGVISNRRLKGACIGILDKLAGGQAGRYALTQALTGVESSTGLKEAHWYAFLQMVDPHNDEERGWVGREKDEQNLYSIEEIVGVIMDKVGVVEQLPLLGPPSGIEWDPIKEKVDLEHEIEGRLK